MYNGILVNSGTGIVVRDNTVLNASGTVHTSTQIVVPSGAVVENNITTSYKGGMSGSNLVLDANNAGSAYYYDKFLANADAGLDVTLADLLPKAGTLAATKGAWQHLNELLSGNGSSSSGNTDGGQTGNGGGTTDPDTPPRPPPPPEPEVADLIYALNGNREFNGSQSAVISVDHRRAFETDQGTIAFSFNADNVTRHQGLVSKDANGFVDGGGNHMTILINNGELRAWFEDGDSSVRLSVGGLKANREYDVVATFDHDTVKLFLDGKLVDLEQFVMNWEDNDQTLLIGGNGLDQHGQRDENHQCLRRKNYRPAYLQSGPGALGTGADQLTGRYLRLSRGAPGQAPADIFLS